MTDPTDTRLQGLRDALADHYRFDRLVAEGGMARVWLAHDQRHDRQVAIKVLKPELSALIGAERFLAEIRTTANLQHPHILPLFDSGEVGGALYYVMPYVEGESLRDRIDRERQLPVDEAVELTIAIGNALDYAHRHGVIHRDIKPANILLHEGNPLVADFGIALAVTSATGDRITETGLSLGTPHYMSPEQATADRDLTARSDIYSTGCMLYEMLTGSPPHTGPTAQAILISILTEDHRPVTDRRRAVPANVAAAVDRALERLPADRFESAEAFVRALKDPNYRYDRGRGATGSTVAPAVAAAPGAERWLAHPASRVAAAAIVALTALLLWSLGRAGGAASGAGGVGAGTVTRVQLSLDPFADPERGDQLAISPDGSMLAFTVPIGEGDEHVHRLMVRPAGALTGRVLADSEGAGTAAFSPDGQHVAVVRSDDLWRLPVAGGRAVRVTSGQEIDHPVWGEDGFIYFDAHGGLFRAPEQGGEAEVVLEAPLHTASHPVPVPGTPIVLFTRVTDDLLAGEIRVLDTRTGEDTHLTDGVDAKLVGGDILLFASHGQAVFAARLDVAGRKLLTAPISVLDSVGVSGTSGEYQVAENGTVLYWSGAHAGAAASQETLVTVDAEGRERPVGPPPGRIRGPRYSPDGDRVVYELQTGEAFEDELWVLDTRTGTRDRVADFGRNAVWSRDGERIAFTRSGVTSDQVYLGSARMAFPPRPIAFTNPNLRTYGFTPDGNSILVVYAGEAGSLDVGTLSLEGEPVLTPYLTSSASENAPELSPDGRWVAYESDEDGRPAVYVRAYPEPGPRYRVSLGRGVGPRWSADGTRLMYRARGDGDSTVVASVRTSPDFEVLSRETWFADAFPGEYIAHELHPTADRVMVVKRPPRPEPGEDPHRLVLAVNWLAEVRARLAEAGGD